LALSGTLQDLGPIELLQLPHSGRKTGEMILVGLDDEARLYYEKGALVHAKSSSHEGLEVLVAVVDWIEGEFEFRKNVKAPDRTINMDLHRAMMNVLKIRDERKKEAEESSKSQTKEKGTDDKMRELWTKGITSFIKDHDFALFAAITDKDGHILSEAGKRPQELDNLLIALTALLKAYPRGDINRLFLEDDDGTVVLEVFGENECLLAMADKGARMGAVALSVSRTVQEFSS